MLQNKLGHVMYSNPH